VPSLQAQKSEADGRTRLTFERGALEPFTDVEPLLPGDVPRLPHISFATGKSWQAVATRYAEVVDEQLRGAEVKSLVQGAGLAGRSPQAVAATLATKLHSEIRYTGVEATAFNASAILRDALPSKSLPRGNPGLLFRLSAERGARWSLVVTPNALTFSRGKSFTSF
jgi:hypothetical protein